MPETTARTTELVLDAKIYVYVDLDGRTVTHVEIDYDRQPTSCDPAGDRDEAWMIALGRGGQSRWPTATWT